MKQNETLEEKNKLADGLWSKCIDCQYNNGKKEPDSYYFRCSANINEFPCEMIPVLYPHKLFDKLQDNLNDGQIIVNGSSLYEPYIVELYDKINDNLIKILVAANNKNQITDYFDNILKNNRNYRHLSINQIINNNDFFRNYSILIVPNEVSRIVFPESYIEMEAYGQKIELEEIVYDFVRYPCVNENDQKPANLSINERLSAKSDGSKANKGDGI